MPSWYIEPGDEVESHCSPYDPDAIERPKPYTDEEWKTAEGAGREYHLVGRVVENGFEAHTTKATVRAASLEEAIALARAQALERGTVTAGWIAL